MSYLRDAEQLNNQALTLSANGDLTNAIKNFKEANVLFEQVLGNHVIVATTHYNIGLHYQRMDDKDAAMESFEKALEMYKKLPGDNRVDIADVVIQMAELFYRNSEYDKALPLYYENLAIREEIPSNVSVTISLGKIGAAHELLGQYDDAVENYKKALSIKRQQTTCADFETVVWLYNVGDLYNKLSVPMHDEAMGLLQEALEITKEIKGSENEVVAKILFSIGHSHYNRFRDDTNVHESDSEECLKCWEEALRIQKMTIGNHKDTAQTLCFMGLLYYAKSCPHKALQAFQECLAVYRAIGQQTTRADFERAKLLNRMGEVYNKLSMHDEAMGVLQEALEITKEIKGSENEFVAKILVNIGHSHFDRFRGDTDVHESESEECLKCWEEALRIQKMTIGNHEDTARTLYFMGLLTNAKSRSDKALQAFQECLAVYRAIGINDGDIVTTVHDEIATLSAILPSANAA